MLVKVTEHAFIHYPVTLKLPIMMAISYYGKSKPNYMYLYDSENVHCLTHYTYNKHTPCSNADL